jgi:hypothetical protein
VLEVLAMTTLTEAAETLPPQPLVFEVGTRDEARVVWCEGGKGWLLNPATLLWEELTCAPGIGGRALTAQEQVALVVAHGRPTP